MGAGADTGAGCREAVVDGKGPGGTTEAGVDTGNGGARAADRGTREGGEDGATGEKGSWGRGEAGDSCPKCAMHYSAVEGSTQRPGT